MVDIQTENNKQQIKNLAVKSLIKRNIKEGEIKRRNINKFNKGDIIYNLSTDQLQLWSGVEWIDLYSGQEDGVQAKMSLGKVTIITNGATAVPIR